MSSELSPNAAAADLPATFRAEFLQAAFGPEPPNDDTHRVIVAWCGAASANTLRALRSDLKIIDAFQRGRGRPALPLTPVECFLLIDERARLGRAKSTVARLVASAVRLHELAGLPSPVDQTVKWKLKEIRKNDTRPVRQALGLRIKGEVDDVHADEPHPISLLQLLTTIPDDAAGLRDRALLSCAYDAGLRRSEVVRAKIEHIDPLSKGEGSLFIPRSKTDQEGEGARVWLSARSMSHLKDWLKAAQLEQGYMFRPLSYKIGAYEHLSEQSVGRILKGRLRALLQQLVEEERLTSDQARDLVRSSSAHSLRVGCDQDLIAAGVDIGAIMQGLRWSSPKQALAYARHLAPASSKLAAVMRRVR